MSANIIYFSDSSSLNFEGISYGENKFHVS
jgi:hypothetical protein